MQPAEGIRFVHIAIKAEVRELEADAIAADSPDALAAFGARLDRFATIVEAHNAGEEDGLFADLEQRAPRIAATYLFDHHDETELFAALRAQLATARGASAPARAGELAKLRRHAIALTEHVTAHVRKEDTLITPAVVELFSPPEQGAQIGKMMARFSPELMAQVMPWMVGKLELDDRCAYLGMIQRVMPPERFPIACGWIRGGIGDAAWAALAARVPGLPA